MDNHQACYVALSRGRTSDGTLIIRNVNAKHIQGGCSGALRQEFRELEILDEITYLRYWDLLPEEVNGSRRKDLISAYRKWKGPMYFPPRMPEGLAWTNDVPKFDVMGKCLTPDVWLDIVVASLDWKVIHERNGRGDLAVPDFEDDFVNVSELKSRAALKRKGAAAEGERPAKRSRNEPKPVLEAGSQWENNSCAYDCIASLFGWIAAENPAYWLAAYSLQKANILNHLTAAMRGMLPGDNTTASQISELRNILRSRLASRFPQEFVPGMYVDVPSVFYATTQSEEDVFLHINICPVNANHEHPSGAMHRYIRFNSPFITSRVNSLGTWVNGFRFERPMKCQRAESAITGLSLTRSCCEIALS
ncbi:hypothetical protein BD626DRAFT_414859 [Schizophyllum amplum]|uniref:Uncharacterized protein n=1 Tax=Schizophyllum amplum TaxID=97359 RepID=A0A550BTW5_9AGAR|nr:hypothetical protein BD626DRAFT_414859 [Auriculariopsis ampla]